MVIPSLHQLSDDLYRLGSLDVPVYLLKTGVHRWALIEGGLSADAERVWTQLRRIVRTPADVADWLITHKHYDHCGLLPILLPRLPEARCHVPLRMRESLQSGEACIIIASQNARLCTPDAKAPSSTDWQRLSLAVVRSGDHLTLGDGYQVEVLEAGGHSDDQVAYYDATRERLFVGDAFGEFDPATGLWRPLAFDDYGAYLATLERLSSLPVREVLAGHDQVRDAPARHAAGLAKEGCRRLEHDLHEAVHHGMGADVLAHTLHLSWRDRSESFLSKEMHLTSMRRLVQRVQQHIAHSSQGKHVH